MPSSARGGRTPSASPAATPPTRRGSSPTAPTGRPCASTTGSSACTPCSAPTGRSSSPQTSDAGVDHVRFALGLDDDHSEFLRRFAADPLLGETLRRLRGLRPMRTGTVAQALLRAVAGQLIQASRARQIERHDHPRRDAGARRPACAADVGRPGPVLAGAARPPRPRRTPRRLPDPALPLARPRAAEGAAVERRRGATRARARARPVVGGRRLHRRPRPLRARARARSRPRRSSPRRSGAAGPSRKKPTCCSSPTANGRGSRASICWRASAAVSYPCPMSQQPDLHVVDDPAAVVAGLLAEQARRGGSIVLTGGASVGEAYERAAELEPDWSKVTLWWGDERCVPPDDELSNYRLAKETLLDRLAVAPQAVHRMRGELDRRRPPPTSTTRRSRRRAASCCCSGSAATATWPRSSPARRSSRSRTAAPPGGRPASTRSSTASR